MKKIISGIGVATLAITLSSTPASAGTGEDAAMCGGGLFLAAQAAGDGNPAGAGVAAGMTAWACGRTVERPVKEYLSWWQELKSVDFTSIRPA